MAKLSTNSPLCMLIIIALLLAPSSAAAYSEPKVTNLRFFLQTTFSGPNTSVYPVARSEITSNSPTISFGLVMVYDEPLTIHPNPDSEMLGRSQGTIAFADLNEQAIHVSLTFHFTSGEFNGSTLTMVGRYSSSQTYRRLPIVGGTGAFQLAQGIATTMTYSTSPQNDRLTREFNITIVQLFRLFG